MWWSLKGRSRLQGDLKYPTIKTKTAIFECFIVDSISFIAESSSVSDGLKWLNLYLGLKRSENSISYEIELYVVVKSGQGTRVAT